MIRKAPFFTAAVVAISLPANAHANAWEKNFRAIAPNDALISWSGEPETVPSTGDLDADLEAMWRKGFALVGYSSFKSDNSKTSDAVRFGKKIGARFVILQTQLASSRTAAIPWTTPTTSTTNSSGTATVYSNRGSATGTYSGTSTTYGSQTTIIPFTINTFDKAALYFKEFPRSGSGISPRELNNEEISTLETRRGFVVLYVRDGSPAYNADILRGDIVTHLNDKPFEISDWSSALVGENPLKLTIVRNGQMRTILMTIPPDWRPAPSK